MSEDKIILSVLFILISALCYVVFITTNFFVALAFFLMFIVIGILLVVIKEIRTDLDEIKDQVKKLRMHK